MAKFWPLHDYNQCMGENRRKTTIGTTLYSSWESERVNQIFLTNLAGDVS